MSGVEMQYDERAIELEERERERAETTAALEAMEYGELQRLALLLRVRANQSPAALREELADREDEVAEYLAEREEVKA